MANSAPVVISSDQSTLPVSLSSSPLPSGAATSAKQPALGVAGTASSDVITVQGIASMTALKVDGSAVVQPVSINVNTNGSASNSITVGSGSATTFTAPTNAVGFVVESESSNTVNLRYACGTTATTTVGMLLEPGRDSGYIPSKGTVTIIALTGSNQSASIQWVLSS